MVDSLAGVVLAAGAGTRLRPLTDELAKALCPVANRPLVDWALDRLEVAGADPAVNAHHGLGALRDQVAGRAHLSVEEERPLGTAGGLGHLRPWIDGRPVLVTNADAWLGGADTASGALRALQRGWDGEQIRLLCVTDPERGDFGDRRYCGMGLLPWWSVRDLAPEPAGLYEVSWAAAFADGRLELVDHPGRFIDCGTPADYLAANLAASGGAPVIDPAAEVGRGAEVVRSVIWAGATVAAGEVLMDAVRTPQRTVLVRAR